MASTGNVFAGTGENNAGIGATAWTNPGTITLDNATDATCNAAASSQYLVARNFDFSSVPDNAVIVGITVRAEASEHSSGTENLNAQLQDASGALTGSSQAQNISGTGKTVYVYGGAADVWGATLTPAIVKDADFGVRFWFTTAHDVRVDFVTMAVEYELPPTPKTWTAAPQVTRARELAGFAVAFAAAAAHIPPPAGTDTIGAAEYKLGTHQSAQAERQPKPWVRGTPSALIPGPAAADSPQTRIVITLPQRSGERASQVWHALIPSDVIQGRLLATGPQSVATTQPAITRALIPAPAVADTALARIVVTAPQRVADRQPGFSKALILEAAVGTDAIGAANFTVGTHRPAQSKSTVFRSLITAPAGTDVQLTRLIVAAPQRVPTGSAQVYAQQPADVEDRLYARYYEADQQVPRQPQPYFARAKIDAPQVDTPQPRMLRAGLPFVQQPQPFLSKALIEALPIHTPQPRTLLAGPQRVPSGQAQVTRARIDDTPLSKTVLARGASLQQPQPVFARAQIEPLPVQTPNARTLYAHQQVLEHRAPKFFGRIVVEAAVADTFAVRFVSAAPQRDARNASQVWHAQIVETVSARFVWVAPQPSADGRGWVKSPGTEYQILGTDVAVGTFGFADQRFVPIQYAIASRIAVSWQVAGGKVATFEAGFDDVFFEPRTPDDVYFEPTAFDVTKFDAKEA